MRIRSAPRRARFGLGYCIQADSWRGQSQLYAKKMFINDAQVKIEKDAAFHPKNSHFEYFSKDKILQFVLLDVSLIIFGAPCSNTPRCGLLKYPNAERRDKEFYSANSR